MLEVRKYSDHIRDKRRPHIRVSGNSVRQQLNLQLLFMDDRCSGYSVANRIDTLQIM